MPVITPGMRATTLLLCAAAMGTTALGAQVQDVRPGARIRVTATSPRKERVWGTLVSPIRDTVFMQAELGKFLRPKPPVPRAYALSGVERVDESDGSAHLTGALQGAAFGAAVSLAYGGLVFLSSNLGGGGYYAQQTKVSGWRSATTASIALVPICALIRGLNAPDKWRRVFPAP